MRIAVVGASGRTGRTTVEHALAAGHSVVAVVRSADRAPAGTEARVAEARDVAALTAAVSGADAVISCLGHVAGADDPHLLADGAAALVQSVDAASVRRVVFVSAAAPFVAGDDPLSRFVAKPILGRLFHADDTRAFEQIVRASDLDWTLLRPSRLTAGMGSPGYRRRVELAVWWHYSTRFDTVGRAAVDALTTPEWVRHAVFITG